MKNMLNKLSKRIVLQKSLETTDDNGMIDISWKDGSEVFAYISAISDQRIVGNEVIQSMQLVSKSPYLFIIRYLDGVNSKMRIKYGERIFNILRVINIEEKNIWLKIVTEEETI
jgi:SPP1 family predicted phage head-tail adaptor